MCIRDRGNTVIVVEHDMRVAASSDWVLDMGPGAGGAGGHVVVAGTPDVVARHRGSLTAPFLGALICLMIEVAVGRQRAV